MSSSSKRSFRFFFQVFLIVLFPIHAWESLMIFNDLSFIAERTNYWDAIGFAGYQLLFALVESLLVATLLWAFIFLLPKKWTEPRTLSIAASIYYPLAAASFVDMAAHAFSDVKLAQIYLVKSDLDPLYALIMITSSVTLTIAVGIFLLLKFEKMEKVIYDLLGRIMVLGYLYLFIDALGVILVILRNLSNTF